MEKVVQPDGQVWPWMPLCGFVADWVDRVSRTVVVSHRNLANVFCFLGVYHKAIVISHYIQAGKIIHRV